MPELRFLSEHPEPIVAVKRTPGTEDITFGFEGGRAERDVDGIYWIFTAEMYRVPVMAGMRCAIWRSAGRDPAGPWHRHGTIATSNQSFPMVEYAHRCNQPWCGWQGATPDRMTYTASFKCDTSDLMASPWAPIPVFDEGEDRWHVLFVSYRCDFTELVAAGAGNIMGAYSEVPGRRGIGGPYRLYHGDRGPASVVLGPDADPRFGGTRWGTSHRTDKYTNQMGVYSLGQGRGYAAFISSHHYLGTAPSVRGPWTVRNASDSYAISTPTSSFNENSIASAITAPTGRPVFGTVFDTVFRESHGMGFAYSEDGLTWGPGAGKDVAVPRGVRTPLGLIEEPDGAYTVFFTRRFADCANQARQEDNCGGGGFGAAFPTMCANLYASRFAVFWRHQLTGAVVDSRHLARHLRREREAAAAESRGSRPAAAALVIAAAALAAAADAR